MPTSADEEGPRDSPATAEEPPAQGEGDGAGGAAEARRGRVLVVDDEPVVRRAVRRALRVAHDVELAASVRAAMSLIAAGDRFDLILCDLHMPGLDGVDLCEWLGANAPEVLPRVVIMTGGVGTARAQRFLDRLGNEVIDKPFDTAAVRSLARRRVDGNDADDA